ncbi:MAG: hypothetical protein K9J79_11000 [Desulfobacteraceae bacterium]|nr:hypothetical protein [Desulfobacteraceae bacterium]
MPSHPLRVKKGKALEVTSSEITRYTKDGQLYVETETVIGINVENKELQRRALDMAFKMKGSYAPGKKEHTGKNGTEIHCEATHKLSPELQELFNEVTGRDTGTSSNK